MAGPIKRRAVATKIGMGMVFEPGGREGGREGGSLSYRMHLLMS